MKLYIDNIQIPNTDISGLQEIEVTLQAFDASGNPARTFSTEVTFEKGTYQLLRDEVINNPKGDLTFFNVKVYDDNELEYGCCFEPDGSPKLVLDGLIKGNSIKWNEGECKLTATIFSHNFFLDCFHSNVIWESEKTVNNSLSTGFTSQNHPRFQWCDDPGNNQLGFRFGIAFGFTELLITLTPIILGIQLIINSIQLILVTLGLEAMSDVNTSKFLDNYVSFIKAVERYVSGCGNYHPAPLQRAYAQNICDLCGLQFKSSIINDSDSPYYDAVYLDAPISVGTNEGDNIEYLPGTYQGQTQYWVQDNAPILSGDAYMEKLKPLYNAIWCIKLIPHPVTGLLVPTLVFERKDWLYNQPVWIDFTNIDPKRIQKIEYGYIADDIPAYADIKFQTDGLDASGDKRIPPEYRAIVEWNKDQLDPFVSFQFDPYINMPLRSILPFANPAINPLQVGAFDITTGFGAVAVRGDDVIRDPRGDAIAQIGDVGAIFRKADKALLISEGKTSAPKAMIWDTASGVDEARVKEYFSGPLINSKGHAFNEPFFVRDINYDPAEYVNDKLQMTPEGNIYHNFYQIENPRLFRIKRRTYTLTFDYTCNDLNTVDVTNTVILPYGGNPQRATMQSVKIGYGQKRQMVVTGLV